MLVVPELRGDEDVLALQARDFGQGLLEALGYLDLVLIDLGQVQVAVADLEGLVHAVLDLAGGSLPGAVSQEGDRVAGAEGGGLSGGHYG